MRPNGSPPSRTHRGPLLSYSKRGNIVSPGWQPLVPLGKNWIFHRPDKSKTFWVNSRIFGGTVPAVRKIANQAVVHQGEKTMSTASWDDQSLGTICTKLENFITPKSLRSLSHVKNNIKNFSLNTRDKLIVIKGRKLIMHSAHNILGRASNKDLFQFFCRKDSAERIWGKKLEEFTTRVFCQMIINTN